MEDDTSGRFDNRQAAGRLLAATLQDYADQAVVVYALPRGGVEVGVEIAKQLQAPLDLVIPRKIGHPFDPEYALAAVAESGIIVGDSGTLAAADQTWLLKAIQHESAEAARRRKRYASGRPTTSVKDKIAIITDDGVATGLTMRAAIADIRTQAPASIVVAVPVIPSDIKAVLEQQADQVIALLTPNGSFGSISMYYDTFEQVGDSAVMTLLQQYDVKK